MAVTAEPFLLFVLASVIVELTPGPNMAWLAVVAAAEGRRQGYAAVAGVALGLALVGLAAALGLAAAIADSPAAWYLLRWGGIAWLMWLAIDGWRDADRAADTSVAGGMTRAFRRGLVTNLLNPKAAVFYLTVVPAFAGVTATLPGTLALTATYVAVATAIHVGIVTLAGAAQALLTDTRRSRPLRRVLSAALAAVALWFLWTTR